MIAIPVLEAVAEEVYPAAAALNSQVLDRKEPNFRSYVLMITGNYMIRVVCVPDIELFFFKRRLARPPWVSMPSMPGKLCWAGP